MKPISVCCAPKKPFVPKQVLKAVDQIDKLCTKRREHSKNDPDFQLNTNFGLTIEMSTDGDTLVIGASNYDAKDENGIEQENSGAVFVFKRKKSFAACENIKNKNRKYQLQQILVATDPETGANAVEQGALFGVSVSVSASGNRIAVVAPGQGDIGAVYVFDQKHKSFHYKAVQKILPPEDTVADNVVGLSKNGRVLVFLSVIDGSNRQILFYEDCSFDYVAGCTVQTKQKTLFVLKQTFEQNELSQGTAIPPGDVSTIRVLLELDETGNTVLVSTPRSAGLGVLGAGVVFVLRRNVDCKCNSHGSGNWSTAQALTSKVPQARAHFGESISLTPDGRFAAIEEPGRDKTDPLRSNVGLVSVFEHICTSKNGNNTSEYALVQELCATGDDIVEADSGQENSVSISNDGCTIAVGYELSTVSEQEASGAVVIYQRRCSSIKWKQTQVLTAFPSIEENQTFGTGLAMSGNGTDLAVGAFISSPQDFVYIFASQFA